MTGCLALRALGRIAILAALCGCSNPAITASPKQIRVAVQDRYNKIVEATKDCDAWGAVVQGAIEADVQTLYETAVKAKDVCWASSQAMDEIDPPGGIGDHAGTFKAAFKTIGLAYFAKSDSFDKLSKAVDGGMHPAAVADMKEAVDLSATELAQGMTEFAAAADGVGVKESEYALGPTTR